MSIVGPGLLVLTLMLPVVLVATLDPGRPPLGGPLGDADFGAGSTTQGITRTVGQPASFGLFVDWNSSEEIAVLDEIRPIDPSGGIEVVGTGVLGPEHESLEVLRGFPPPVSPLARVRGYAVPTGSGPLDGFQVVVGLLATEPGLQFVPAFELRYHVGDREYVDVLLQGAWICVPSGSSRRCPERVELAERQRELGLALSPFVLSPDRETG